jgi:hypothetical protein
VRCGGVAASPGRAVCVLGCGRALDGCEPPTCAGVGACDAPAPCGALPACDPGADEFAAVELPACDATSAASLCACAASDVAAPGCTVGCAGPLGCGIAGPLLSAEADRACESSPKLMVYDLNGGSSDEVGAAPAGTGADGPFGPDNSSGTNNTIRTTRMIAPVSRSFTRSTTVGTKPLQSSGRAREPYGKPYGEPVTSH